MERDERPLRSCPQRSSPHSTPRNGATVRSAMVQTHSQTSESVKKATCACGMQYIEVFFFEQWSSQSVSACSYARHRPLRCWPFPKYALPTSGRPTPKVRCPMRLVPQVVRRTSVWLRPRGLPRDDSNKPGFSQQPVCSLGEWGPQTPTEPARGFTRVPTIFRSTAPVCAALAPRSRRWTKGGGGYPHVSTPLPRPSEGNPSHPWPGLPSGSPWSMQATAVACDPKTSAGTLRGTSSRPEI